MNKKLITTVILGVILGAGGNYYLQQRPIKVAIIKPTVSNFDIPYFT